MRLPQINADSDRALTPRAIVEALDRYVIGQHAAKRAVAIALRNRWRRRQLPPELIEEVQPKNILMVGPTGVGKTEIARRLAKMISAPFMKVEATKFTEIGYVGRDVEQIVRDLVAHAVTMCSNQHQERVADEALKAAQEQLIIKLSGSASNNETRAHIEKQLRAGEFDNKEIDIDVPDTQSLSMPLTEIPGMPGSQFGSLNLNDILGKAFNPPRKKRRVAVTQALELLTAEETEKRLDSDKIHKEAIHLTENEGIVFIDEIDKIVTGGDDRQSGRADVSRAGVQRDLLPLIEGTAVSTRYGTVRTDHILFICSGAFHFAKPSDLLPELQGRLPIRVSLRDLSAEDFKNILCNTENALAKQYKALLATEGVKLQFDDDALEAIADLSVRMNRQVENIGARRLHTVLEYLLEDISFEAPDHKRKTYKISEKMARQRFAPLLSDSDLGKFVL